MRRVSQPTRWTQRIIESKFRGAHPSSTPREDVLSMELYEGIDVWQLHLYVVRGTAGFRA